MSHNFLFQKASPDDAAQIAEFERSNFGEEGFSKKQISYLISKAKGEVLVAKISEKVVANLILLFRKNSRQLRIYSLAVSSQMRGKGLAKQMILLSEKWAKKMGMERLSLEVNENNRAAIQLYLSTGFQITQTKKEYYKDGSSALVMRKKLL